MIALMIARPLATADREIVETARRMAPCLRPREERVLEICHVGVTNIEQNETNRFFGGLPPIQLPRRT